MLKERYDKEWYVQMHRQMWNDIADEIERKKSVLYIPGLKGIWCFGRMEHSPLSNCFACEYAGSLTFCNCERNCLFNWAEGNKFTNCLKGGYYEKCKEANTWEEQAALARKIANLPVRENLPVMEDV